MKCKNCGKEIDEYEVFCEDCKKHLKSISSRKEVNELEDLIEDQRKLNDLEQTKELPNLSDLAIDESKIDKLSIEDEEEDKNIQTREERINNEQVKTEFETREERISNDEGTFEEKKGKKKLIIIILSIVLVIVLTIVLTLVLTKDNGKQEKEEPIDYEKIINEYGKSIENTIHTYLGENDEIPTWSKVNELNKYDQHEIVCETHNIYNDGSIYLNECKVDEKKVKYSYGEEKEEVKEGKKLSIYKVDYSDDYYRYSPKNEAGSSLVATITCKTENCEYIEAYDKYVFVKEEDKYYLYNYENDSMEFGPFDLNENYYENLLLDDKNLYGIYYNENGTNNIYNVNTGKILKNITGTLVNADYYGLSNVLYKYNYAILLNKSVNNFVNLKTGNISYSIKENLGKFVEDTKNKIVYMAAYTNSDYNKFKLYNSNGKELFDGKEFTYFNVNNGNIIVSSETEYKVYDSKLNLKLSSKKYDQILGVHEDFIVVIEDSYLKIIDLEDKELAEFVWDNEKYYYHDMISGWYTENGKNGIYLVVENKEIPYGTSGSGMEYYYIPSSKEAGVIMTDGVGGYAKPVLYLYPEKETNITVTFSNPSVLTTTYPKFKNSWQVKAYPNGDLYDFNGNYYYALYWEEEKNHQVDFSEGFYVTKDSAIDFLEEKLSIIGLNAKERNEFIMYWLPILEKNGKSLVYFELTDERDKYNKLFISPKPDSILRIAMHVKKVNKKTSIKKQALTSFDRTGFTAVEWGGVIY